MSWITGVRARLQQTFGRRAAEERMDEEIRFHVEMETEKNLRAGMSPQEARRRARLAFGGMEGHREVLREGRRIPLVEDAWRDLRYAARSLARSPGFTAAAVLTLALGIGANTAMFSVVEAVLLRPLPFPEPEQLVVPASVRAATEERWSITYADFLEWQEHAIFAQVAVYQEFGADLSGEGDPRRVEAMVVSPDFFAVLRTPPLLGRVFHPEEFVPETERVVVLSYGLWQSQFGGDPGVIGRTVNLMGLPRTVVGVMPPGFPWLSKTELWAPMRIGAPSVDLLRRDNYVFNGLARLRPDATLEQTRARLAALARQVAEEQPAVRGGITLTAVPLNEWALGEVLPSALWVLLGAVGFILLIGCVNIANLLLARAAARQREFAVRAALGAGRLRLIRQLLAESLLLALVGGVLGILFALWGVRALVALAPSDIPRLAEVGASGSVLAFTALISLLAALLFGLAPALYASLLAPGAVLGEGGQRSTGGRRGRRARNLLVAAELALSLVLLVGAGLALRSLARLQGVDAGFHTEQLITLSLDLPGARYPGGAQVTGFLERVVERLEALPGVQSAAVSSALPLGGGGFYLGRSFLAEGEPEPPAGTEVGAQWNVVGPGYFGTLGIPLLAGRDFTLRDDSASTPVIIVNEQFARTMFPDGNVLGRRVQSWREEKVLREIVAVVRDVRYFGASDEPRPLVYVPHRQDPWNEMMVVLRTAGDPTAIVAAARREIASLDPDLALGNVSTMEQALAESLAAPRFQTLLLSTFASLALLLVAVGLYGVLSYTISQRTREIGVRVALGARRGNVLSLVVREALGVVALGTIAGAAGALAITRVMRSLLYEISPTDPATFAAVVALLVAVALLASYLPARRAARVDPMIALRAE